MLHILEKYVGTSHEQMRERGFAQAIRDMGACAKSNTPVSVVGEALALKKPGNTMIDTISYVTGQKLFLGKCQEEWQALGAKAFADHGKRYAMTPPMHGSPSWVLEAFQAGWDSALAVREAERAS